MTQAPNSAGSHRTRIPGASEGTPPGAADGMADAPWERPSARSLLVSPLKHVQDSLPAVLPLVALAFSQGGHARWLLLLAVAAPVGFAVMGWYFTGYRLVGDQFQVRRGAVHKQRSTVQVERIRTVNSQATALRRLLRVTDVEVGTGADQPLKLHGLDSRAAARLQRTLLNRSASIRGDSPAFTRSSTALPPGAALAPGTVLPADATPPPGMAVPTTGADVPAWGRGPSETGLSIGDTSASVGHPVELARFDPAWLRLAPFTLSGVATAAAALGLLFNVADEIDVVARLGDWARDAWEGRPQQPLALVLAESGLAALVTLAVLSVIAYALSNWGYRLTRQGEGTLHVVRGLLTSRSTTIEESRLRGAVLERPLLLSAAGGMRAKALLTGAREGPGNAQTSDVLTPPAPAHVVRCAVVDVLATGEPLEVALVSHGPAAARRRWTRALVGALPAAALVGAGAWQWQWPGWTGGLTLVPFIVAAALARLRAARLGHAVTTTYLVASEGVFPHRRAMVRSSAVIGWMIEESWFQRRQGLVTLSATVAATGGRVRMPDVPRAQALAVLRATTPGLTERYVA